MKLPVFASALAFAQSVAAADVEYQLTPLLSEQALTAVQVDLRFAGDADGETLLDLPDSWGGEEELWRELEDIQVIAGAEIADGETPSARILRHPPGSRIHLRYRIVQNWKKGPPTAADGNPYRPIIQPTWFHLIGNAALILPELEESATARIRVDGLPPGWSFASDLEHAGLTLGQARASISVGGDYRIVSNPSDGLRVAIRGDWEFADEQFLASVARITQGHRRFWKDADAPFLVSMTNLVIPEPGQFSLGGTGLEDAFAFFATPNVDERRIARLLAHEALHTWIPSRIGNLPATDEAADYWLSEGFTEFYTARLMVKEGSWSPQEFAVDLNEMLAAYAVSPGRALPNARVVSDFWKDSHIQQLPYQRGRLVATLWDAQLRASSEQNFDDLVHAMRDRAKAGSELTAVALFREVAAEMGLDVADGLREHIESGVPIVLPEKLFTPCGNIVTRQVPEFHRGFDIDATSANQNIISGTDPDSPAHAAGLRDGMKLLRRAAGEIGNAAIEIEYVVLDGDQERSIRYLPRGKGGYDLQSLQLDPELDAEGRARCIQVLGGR